VKSLVENNVAGLIPLLTCIILPKMANRRMIAHVTHATIRFAGIGAALALFVSVGRAAPKQDYSGQYLLEVSKAQRGSPTSQRLVVQQSDNSVEVTMIDGDKKITNRFSLDSSEGPYTSPGAVTGKCKGKIDGGNLVLESVVVTKPQPFAPPVSIHTKERWHLSSDLKTLTVKSEVDFPGSPEEAGIVTGTYASGSRRYTRIDNP
jgi:hypothetical protein